jgi:hypothetical protein
MQHAAASRAGSANGPGELMFEILASFWCRHFHPAPINYRLPSKQQAGRYTCPKCLRTFTVPYGIIRNQPVICTATDSQKAKRGKIDTQPAA